MLISLKAKLKEQKSCYFCLQDYIGLKKYLFILAVLLSVFSSCDEQNTQVVAETSQSTENSLLAVSEVISTFDIVEDFMSSSQLFLKKDESLIPADADIIILDSEFTDGDGIEAILNFGTIGLEPHGLLCKDNKYRAGKIHVYLDKPYSETDAKLTVSFDKDEAFYSGNGKEMSKIHGSLQLQRISDDELLLHCGELTVETAEQEPVLIVATLSVVRLEKNGEGLVNDKLSFDGTLEVNSLNDDLTFNIVEPLNKDYNLSCAQYIKIGKIDVEPHNSASVISIDFDPNKDAACDHTVGITVNGRTFMYSY